MLNSLRKIQNGNDPVYQSGVIDENYLLNEFSLVKNQIKSYYYGILQETFYQNGLLEIHSCIFDDQTLTLEASAMATMNNLILFNTPQAILPLDTQTLRDAAELVVMTLRELYVHPNNLDRYYSEIDVLIKNLGIDYINDIVDHHDMVLYDAMLGLYELIKDEVLNREQLGNLKHIQLVIVNENHIGIDIIVSES